MQGKKICQCNFNFGVEQYAFRVTRPTLRDLALGKVTDIGHIPPKGHIPRNVIPEVLEELLELQKNIKNYYIYS